MGRISILMLLIAITGVLGFHGRWDCPLAYAQEYKTGDKVQVHWKGQWYTARIKNYNAARKCWNIHYDNYSDSWDECVGKKRIKSI